MKEYEYMRLHISDIPEEIINQYNLHAIADDN
jgi:retron-type reverse transcriptase